MARLVTLLAALVTLWGLALWPASAEAATCSDYPNQAAAQRAADTRDGDGDGRYCESLPCACAGPGEGGSGSTPAPSAPGKPKKSCTLTDGTVALTFSKSKYPNIRRYVRTAIGNGWPRVMVVNRPGADARRDRLLDESGLAPRSGFDRDEYPAAVGRGRPNRDLIGLVRGTDPTGWRASVRYVRSSENRSHGSSLGGKLRRFCNGQRFRYRFR